MRTEVKIAELKGKLSEYLRSVRQGNEVVIKDRDTPIAKLVPYQEPKSRLTVRNPTGSLKDIDNMKFFRPRGLKRGEVDRAVKWVKRDVFNKGLV